MWKVLRFSGRRQDGPRVVYEGNDAAKARAKFKTIADALRQGEVRLVYPSGKDIELVTAPNLRTRW